MPQRRSKTSMNRALMSCLLASAILASSAAAEETKPAHNQAEGDNPALNERALQAEHSGDAPTTSNSQMQETSRASKTDTKPGGTANWASLDTIVEKLIREYYPKAKNQQSKKKLYVEYKAKPYILPSTNKQEQGPDWGGIVIDMELQKRVHMQVFIRCQRSSMNILFTALNFTHPIRKKYDCHLLTRICYPFDVPQEFLKRFKKVVEEFEQYL